MSVDQIELNRSGWIKKRSRHLKQWRRRFTRVEEQQYICTYHDETLKTCTEKIDVQPATIYYTIHNPTEFRIIAGDQTDQTLEFYFKCESITEANDWLRCLKKISKTHAILRTEFDDAQNDLDLVTASVSPRIIKQKGKNVSDDEINQMYMKAISLYQHKHYEECEYITNSVLTVHPKHPEALKLQRYLVQKRYEKSNKNKTKPDRKGVRTRFKTEPNINTNQNESKQSASDEVKAPEEPKEAHPCQIEFRRFIEDKIQLNKYYNDLTERFERAKYDDIRFLKDFDHDILSDEIGLRPLHVKCFFRKVEIFLNEVSLFQTWLAEMVIKLRTKRKFDKITTEGLIGLFENNGITTFEALYLYMKSKQDLERIVSIGDDGALCNNAVSEMLWKEMHRMARKQTLRLNTVAQSYSQVSVSMFGAIEGDHDDAFDFQFPGAGRGTIVDEYKTEGFVGDIEEDNKNQEDIDIIQGINSDFSVQVVEGVDMTTECPNNNKQTDDGVVESDDK
eukprot:140020_1